MSSQDVTVTGLINTIRILAAVPNNEQLSSDESTLLNLLNFQMTNDLVPHLMSVREEYFVDYQDFNNEMVNGVWQDYYDLPQNAIGMKLRDLSIIVQANDQTKPPVLRYVPRISPEDANGIRNSPSNNNGLAFYMKNNGIVLFPCPTKEITFRMTYFRQPNYLVSTSEAGQIISIDTNAKSVVLTNVPTTWSTGNTVDIIQSKQGFGFNGEDVEITLVSSPTLGLTSVDGLHIGDWVALSGNSPIPQIPLVAQAVLAQSVVIKLLEANKDVAGVQLAQAKYKELYDALDFMLTPRVEGEVLKVTSAGKGLTNFLRGQRGWNGYRR